jgi:hypothetical protein
MKNSSGRKISYEVGGIYGFKTSPFTEFSPIETKRFAALIVLGIKPRGVAYLVLDCIFDKMPTSEQVSEVQPLQCQRFASNGTVASRRSPQDWHNDLLDFQLITIRPITEDDLKLEIHHNSYGSWDTASKDAEGEWRWKHDRDAVVSEVKRVNAARDAKFAAEQLHYETRLKGLTCETLLAETAFERWNIHPPFPPPEFVNASRIRIRQAVIDLQALGTKPRKAAVREILKKCVQWFNEIDKAFGYVIETEEREDICIVLLELATVARHRSLAEEIENWREW